MRINWPFFFPQALVQNFCASPEVKYRTAEKQMPSHGVVEVDAESNPRRGPASKGANTKLRSSRGASQTPGKFILILQKFCYKRSLPNSAQRGFTLIEVMICLFLMGIFAGMLMVCFYQTGEFMVAVLNQTRRCQEMRMLCEFLTADCEKLVLRREKATIEFDLRVNGVSSFILLRRISLGWERSFIAQQGEGSICAVQYEFNPRTGEVVRNIWGTGKTLMALNVGTSLMETLSKERVLFIKKLTQDVSHCRIYPINSLGQEQERWKRESSVGVECSLTFRPFRKRIPQSFRIRIPLPRAEEG